MFNYLFKFAIDSDLRRVKNMSLKSIAATTFHGMCFCIEQLRKKCPNKSFSGPYFLLFNPNTQKCGPETTTYLDIFTQ